MKSQKLDLAVIFTRIEKAAGAVEDVAKAILASVKAAKADKLEQFNEMVSEAYGRNGWSQKAGRPSPASKEKPAPDAVKLYVSIIRAAYRLGIKVTTFDTVGGLRVEIRNRRAAHNQSPARPPELRGIQITSENTYTGALWHDAVVLWENLPDSDRVKLEAQVRKLFNQFAKAAPADLAQAA